MGCSNQQDWLGGLICSPKSFLKIERIPRITDSCSFIYVFGCRLSLVRLCDSDFGITALDYITIGITCAAFCFHIEHISFSSSWNLFSLSVMVLPRLCVFGTAMSIKKVFFVFLFIKVMSGRLKSIVLSVSMLRFQYSLKFSIFSTLLLLSSSSTSSSSSSSSSSPSPLCRLFILTFLRQTMSLGNTVLRLFCCYYSWCLHR